ncbi:MAG: RNA polymerase sigma factor [Solirubrobacterales bacterium]
MASRRQDDRCGEERGRELLDRLLRERKGRLLRHARFHSERAQDAEDALGEACVQFLVHFRGADVEGAERWMLVVVRRCAWEIARRRRRRGHIVEEVPGTGSDAAAPAPDPSDPGRLTELIGGLVAGLAELKGDEARAVLLAAAGYSLVEIGAQEDWTYTKVRRALYEGRAHLRRILDREGGEEL